MFRIDEFRLILGESAKKMSDKEVKAIRDFQDRLADILFDIWIKKRNRPPDKL